MLLSGCISLGSSFGVFRSPPYLVWQTFPLSPTLCSPVCRSHGAQLVVKDVSGGHEFLLHVGGTPFPCLVPLRALSQELGYRPRTTRSRPQRATSFSQSKGGGGRLVRGSGPALPSQTWAFEFWPRLTVLPSDSLSLDHVGLSPGGPSLPKRQLVRCPWHSFPYKNGFPGHSDCITPCSLCQGPREQFSSEFIIRGNLCSHRENNLLPADGN